MSGAPVIPSVCPDCAGCGFEDQGFVQPSPPVPCHGCGGLGTILRPMTPTQRAQERRERMSALLDALRAYQATYTDPMLEPGEDVLRARHDAREALFLALQEVEA